jgi:hypothetical protein
MNNNERLKKMLEQDIEWMDEEGFYTVSNRLFNILEYIKKLESRVNYLEERYEGDMPR